MNINQITLAGRLTAPAQIYKTKDDIVIAKFTLAVNHYYKNNGKTVESVDFIPVTAFGRMAEIIKEYTEKGQLLLVQGRIRQNVYENKRGYREYELQVLASNIQLGPKAQNRDTDTQEKPVKEETAKTHETDTETTKNSENAVSLLTPTEELPLMPN